MRIAFIGGGVMGEAILRGVLREGVAPSDITVSDIAPARQEYARREFGVNATGDNATAVAGTDVVVLAVKPQFAPPVLRDLAGRLDPSQLVLSIMAGIMVGTLTDTLRHTAVVRCMPNTPAQIGRGITVWTATPEVSEEQHRQAVTILSAIGSEIFVPDEHFLDMATAVSGSGPAYVFLIAEAWIDAAVQIGMLRPMAEKLVLETLLGSAEYMKARGDHPAVLRNLVTSPGGTTAAALFELEEGRTRATFVKAVVAAFEKSVALGKGSSK